MTGIVIRVLVNAVALWITTHIVTQVSFGPDATILGIVGVAIVFGLVNAFIRPVLKVMTFPLTILTLGIFGLIVNGILLLIVAALSGAFGLHFTVGDYPPDLTMSALWWAIVGSVVLSIVSAIINMLPLPGDR
ncbi:MAG TPA: phage holin family protein [Candidatus Limnocylindrales bacterium]